MSALPCVFGADCEVVAASVELLAVALLLALVCSAGYNTTAEVCCKLPVGELLEFSTLSTVVAAFTE